MTKSLMKISSTMLVLFMNHTTILFLKLRIFLDLLVLFVVVVEVVVVVGLVLRRIRWGVVKVVLVVVTVV